MGQNVTVSVVNRGIRNPGVSQCWGFSPANEDQKSAVQKPKHSLTPGFLIPLVVNDGQVVTVPVVLQDEREDLRDGGAGVRAGAPAVRGPLRRRQGSVH